MASYDMFERVRSHAWADALSRPAMSAFRKMLFAALAYFAVAQANFAFVPLLSGDDRWPLWVPIWFSAGVGILLVRRIGPVAAIGIAIGSFVNELTLDTAFLRGAVIAANNAAQALLVVHLLMRTLSETHRVGDDPRSVTSFFTVVTLVTALVSAPVGTLAYLAGSPADAASYVNVWLRWVLGDLTSYLCVTPFLLFAIPPRGVEEPRIALDSAFEIALACGLAILTFANWTDIIGYPFLPASFALFPMVALTAVRRPRFTTMTLILALAIVSSAMTAAGNGPFHAWARPEASILMLQCFIVALSLTGLLLSAATHDRKVTQQRLRETLRDMDELVATRTRELLEANGKLRHMIDHDSLTGCLSRDGFIAALTHRRDASGASDASHLFYVDLDGFKAVNDRYGHQTGDQLLRELGRRFAKAGGPGSMIARLGGDEFAVATTHTKEPGSADALAQRLIDSCRSTDTLSGLPLRISASVGIVATEGSTHPIAEWLDMADNAMYAAKGAGGGSAVRFEHIAMLRQRDTVSRVG